MPLRKLSLLSLVALVSVLCAASASAAASADSRSKSLRENAERRLQTAKSRDSEFATVPHTTARASCEATRPPEALATPDPLLDEVGTSGKVTVSFIIGTDGRVYSPFVLESAGPTEDRTVLDTIRSWRYRPAMCNGVATETEAKVEFSKR